LPGNVLKSYDNGTRDGKFCTVIIIYIILCKVLILLPPVISRNITEI